MPASNLRGGWNRPRKEEKIMSNYFDTQIAACTVAIGNIGGNNPGASFADYLKRGALRCLKHLETENSCSGAIEDLSIARSFQPKDLKALYYRAYAYFISKDYDSAIAEYKKLPLPYPVHFNELLGNIHFEKRDYPKAKKCYQEAIEGAVKRPNVLPFLSSSLLENYRKACVKVRGT
jgi:tetratricopeptide (TPR) repeat protein